MTQNFPLKLYLPIGVWHTTLERIKSEYWKNPKMSSIPESLMMPDVAQELRNAYTTLVHRILLTYISNFGWYLFLYSPSGITSGNSKEHKYFFMEEYTPLRKVFVKLSILKSKAVVSTGQSDIIHLLFSSLDLYCPFFSSKHSFFTDKSMQTSSLE